MINLRGPYRIGALFVFLSAALHILTPVVGGLTTDALALIPVGLIYALIGYGLLRGMRWLAYVTFFLLFILGTYAITLIWAASPVPSWWTAAIVIADFLAVAGLFVALWRPAPSQAG